MFHNPVKSKPEKVDYKDRFCKQAERGSDFGVGHKQPIGHAGDPKDKVSSLPYGRVQTMRVDEVR